MNKREDLVLSTATLEVDIMSITLEDFIDQLDAAAGAGFTAISTLELHHDLLEQAGIETDQVLAAMGDRGLTFATVEALQPFAGTEEATLEAARKAFARANGLGAPIVPAVSLDPVDIDSLDEAAERYGRLCDLADEHGLRVPIEFLPWGGVPDLATAWQVVDATDRPAGGIVIDTWHWHRQPGGPDPSLLASIPPSFLPVVQISDLGPVAAEDLFVESVTDRRVPGEGTGDLDGFFTALYATGADPLIAAEVFNADLAAGGRAVMAEQVMAGCRRVLAPYV